VRPRRALLGALIALVCCVALNGVAASAAAPRPQVRLSDIEDEVMCPICGTLLELADSPQALREKAFIARLVRSGRSKDQIHDALVAQYGPEVLALPKASGFDLSAYLVPAIAFAVAVVALGLGVRRWRRDGEGPKDDDPAPPPDEDAERLDADIARYDL
jgi:cytochrome c-type biogenesis protein CcmH/NrfF